jgi:hypothetical protein
MKKNWRVMAIIVALYVVFGGMSGATAQEVTMTGAYGDASITDHEVVAAARFAVRAEGRKTGAPVALLSIERAEQQVVAGINYRLHLKVKTRGKTQAVTAVVYQNLKDKYSLTSWDMEDISAGSESASADSTVEQFVKTVTDTYTAKTLGYLDAEYPHAGKVRIVIENSLADDRAKDRFVSRAFTTLTRAEGWLKSRERDNGPARETMPLKRCRQGLCTFDFDGGILHNHLYLKKIAYGLRSGKPYLKTIYLLDGD